MLLLLLACTLDSKLGTTDDPGSGFDTGESPPDPDTGVDTSDTNRETGDSADTGVESGTDGCPDRIHAAEAIATEAPPTGALVDWAPSTRALATDADLLAPVVARMVDTDGDGALTDVDAPIVVYRTVREFVAIRGDTGAVVWTAGASSSYPEYAIPAVTDLDGDGWLDVVMGGPGFVAARDGRDGSLKWRTAYEWLRRGCDALVAADLDGDGTGEIVAAGAVFDGDGTFLGGATAGYGATPSSTVPGVADLDLDGPLEVVTGLGIYDSTGHVRRVMLTPTDGAVAVGELDGDAEGEVVVVGDGMLAVGDFDGTVHWETKLRHSSNGAPLVADLDGVPGSEIAVVTTEELIVYAADGAELWAAPISDRSSWYTAPVALDFDGDGAAEIVYADEPDLLVLDGATGAVLVRETTHASETGCEQPVVADIDNDGHADILHVNNGYGGPEVGLYVTTNPTWPAVPGVWNQYAYVPTYVDGVGRPVASPPMTWTIGDDLYRGQPNPAPIGATANLRPVITDVCLDECPDDALTVWVQVENNSEEAVAAPFTVELRGETDAGEVVLATRDWTSGVPAGERSESVQWRVQPAPRPLYSLSVVVDAGSQVAERHEDDNVATWGAGGCE